MYLQFETRVRPIERYAQLYYHTSFSDEELIDLEPLTYVVD
jgi:hypothetical protein